ncbi:MAG: hemolysin family protein [Planctomycetota bacterium]
MWEEFGENILMILLAIFLVFLNAFFVAAEFSLVKIRQSKLKVLIRKKKPFARTAQWLVSNMNNALSTCQLGITIASLGLGWIGEPAVADLIRPIVKALGVTSEATVHSIAFIIAFSFITAVHIVAGELAPKTLAIMRTEFTVLSCALPMRIFYIASYPFMWLLNKASDLLLRAIGLIEASASHEASFSEEELRSLLAGARAKGHLTKSKHELLDAIFDMETRLARQIMVPRPDVVFFRLDQSFEECVELALRTKHTRFPLCKHSLDDVKGVIHIKDLLGLSSEETVDLQALARPPKYVPETLPANILLKKFQATKQHLALVLDEHGAVQGIVTLENVVEELIGSVQDEFDEEEPDIIPDGPGSFVVSGLAPLEKISERLGISLEAPRIDTLSGLLFKHAGRVLRAGDEIDLGPVNAEVIEMRSSRAWKVRLRTVGEKSGSEEGSEASKDEPPAG